MIGHGIEERVAIMDRSGRHGHTVVKLSGTGDNKQTVNKRTILKGAGPLSCILTSLGPV